MADMCVFQNSTPCVGGFALRVPRYYPPIPAWTIRVKMSTADGPYPTKAEATVTRLYADEEIYDVTYAGTDWTGLFNNSTSPSTHQIAEVLGSNTAGVTNMSSLFNNQQALSRVTGLTTENVTDMSQMFRACSGLVSVELFDTSNVTDLSNMFRSCISLASSPLFATGNVTDMGYFFNNCRELTQIPLFDTNKVNDMGAAFYNCRKVTNGALDLYIQASSQSTPPRYHSGTFTSCGVDTTTGAAELAQIPSGWK